MDLTQKTRLQGSWRNHLLAFLIPFCGMLLVMLVCGYHPFGTSAMLYSDNYHQYYPFFVESGRCAAEAACCTAGTWAWVWTIWG